MHRTHKREYQVGLKYLLPCSVYIAFFCCFFLFHYRLRVPVTGDYYYASRGYAVHPDAGVWLKTPQTAQ
jgi:hypothetical protein